VNLFVIDKMLLFVRNYPFLPSPRHQVSSEQSPYPLLYAFLLNLLVAFGILISGHPYAVRNLAFGLLFSFLNFDFLTAFVPS
jgi:hypothetical protein